jgi:para-nitrobenzyl esterase
MTRTLIALVLAAGLVSPALAQDAAPAPKFSIQTSTLGQLAADPAAKAIFLKHFPEVVNHPQFNEGLGLTMPDVVQYLPDVVTPEKLAAMDAELKALPQ